MTTLPRPATMLLHAARPSDAVRIARCGGVARRARRLLRRPGNLWWLSLFSATGHEGGLTRCACGAGTMGKEKEEPKKSSKEKRQEKARLKAGAVAKKDKAEEVDEVAEVRCPPRARVMARGQCSAHAQRVDIRHPWTLTWGKGAGGVILCSADARVLYSCAPHTCTRALARARTRAPAPGTGQSPDVSRDLLAL